MKTDIEACKMNLSLLSRSMNNIPSRMYEGKFIDLMHII